MTNNCDHAIRYRFMFVGQQLGSEREASTQLVISGGGAVHRARLTALLDAATSRLQWGPAAVLVDDDGEVSPPCP